MAELEKCFVVKIFGKMCHTWKMCRSWKNVPQLEKCSAVGKMCHTWKNVQHLEKFAIVGKRCQTLKNMPHLEKRAALGKMCDSWNNYASLKNVPLFCLSDVTNRRYYCCGCDVFKILTQLINLVCFPVNVY